MAKNISMKNMHKYISQQNMYLYYMIRLNSTNAY